MGPPLWYNGSMKLSTVLDRLKAHEDQLRAAGVVSLSVFGSVARGEETDTSDVDVAAVIDRRPFTLLDLAGLEIELEKILGAHVDVVMEPTRKARLQQQIDRDRARAF